MEALPLRDRIFVVAFQLAVTPLAAVPLCTPFTNCLSPVTALPVPFAILMLALESIVLDESIIAHGPANSATAAPPCTASEVVAVTTMPLGAVILKPLGSISCLSAVVRFWIVLEL